MSIKLIIAVWDSDLPRDERAIADKFANFANDDGDGIYAGIARIAYLSKYSDRQARRITKKLVNRGVLELSGKSKFNTNQYKFHADQLPEREPFEPEKIGRPALVLEGQSAKVADIGDRDLNSDDSKENGKVADILDKVADISEKVADIQESANPESDPDIDSLDSSAGVPAEWMQGKILELPETHEHGSSNGDVGVVKPKSELTGKEKNGRLEWTVHYFSLKTKIAKPEPKGKKAKAAAAVRWWNPLRAILTACDWDVDRARNVIDAVVDQMDKDELTVSAPQSIESNAIALIGRQDRHGAESSVVVDENGAYL